MNNKIIIVFTVLYIKSLFHIIASNRIYHIYEVIAFNKLERSKLYKFHQYSELITFVNGISNEAAIPNHVVVPQDHMTFFEDKLRYYGLQYYHTGKWTMETYERDKYPDIITAPIVDISTKFYGWNSIKFWIDKTLSKANFVEKVVIAKTYENRDVIMVKISMSSNNPAVVIVGGEVGMDWMSSAILLNFLNTILYNRTILSDLLANFDFYIIPLFNPDGFVYSKTKFRFWTKNRKVMMYNSSCLNQYFPVGVSLGKNWFFAKSNRSKISKFGERCNAIYIGPKPISEEETIGLSYVLNSLALNMIAFINVHGFGNYLSIPYGYTSEQSNNHDIVMEILHNTCKEIKLKFNTSISLGTSNSIHYNSTGNVADWVKYKLNTPIVFTININHEESIQHMPQYIRTMSERFYGILNSSLMISKQIYGPLFSHQSRITNTYCLILFVLLINNICLFFIVI